MTGEQTHLDCLLVPDPNRRKTLRERWEAFHKDNPQVFDAIEKVATEQRRAGRRRISMKAIFEILRSDPTLSTAGERWKLNNIYTAFYARELVRRDPRFDKLIEMRKAG
jgi:hypothetical protein